MREFLGIHKSLQSIQGEFLNNKKWEMILYLNTEKQARLEILSQNRKDLQTQVSRIAQTLEKVLDKNTSSAERIHTLFHE